MTVKKSERNESKLSVILKAEDIVLYTLQITANEKTFPKRHRWQLTNRLVDAVLEILQDLTTANAVRVVDAETMHERHRLQEHAYTTSVWFLTAINIAFRFFHLPTNSVEYWTGLIIDLQRQLRAWQKSDEARYAEHR